MIAWVLSSTLLLSAVAQSRPQMHGQMYRMPSPGVETRWYTFENPTGARGAGGKANQGAKGAAYRPVKAGETVVLADIEGSGTLRRMWVTLRDRSPKALRSYVLRMYWDGSERPAVEVPFGDFFGAIHGRTVAFQSELFANPEGRSFNSFVQMPFRKGARVTFTNESPDDLLQIYYEIDATVGEQHPEDALYFHATWRRERWTELGRDFEILPRVEGRGRYLGAHIGIFGHPGNDGWWGEGEVKVYLDGDGEWPTLVGTGTEDYIGTAYGQGTYSGPHQGSLIVDDRARVWAFYRHHVPDPVWFHREARVTIQQMGATSRDRALVLARGGVEIKPTSVQDNVRYIGFLDENRTIEDPDLPNGVAIMYRRDDVSAVALFYLDRPENGLPPLAPLEKRIEAIQ
jgi:hypothetical protein